MELYKILRFYQSGKPSVTKKRHLSLEEAQEHCKNPETSSTTCVSAAAVRHTKSYGSWFDGYTRDETAAQRKKRVSAEEAAAAAAV